MARDDGPLLLISCTSCLLALLFGLPASCRVRPFARISHAPTRPGSRRVTHFEILVRGTVLHVPPAHGDEGARSPGISTALPAGLIRHSYGPLNASLGACVQSRVCSLVDHYICRVVWTVDRAFLYQTICVLLSPPSSLHSQIFRYIFIDVSKFYI